MSDLLNHERYVSLKKNPEEYQRQLKLHRENNRKHQKERNAVRHEKDEYAKKNELTDNDIIEMLWEE